MFQKTQRTRTVNGNILSFCPSCIESASTGKGDAPAAHTDNSCLEKDSQFTLRRSKLYRSRGVAYRQPLPRLRLVVNMGGQLCCVRELHVDDNSMS
jgi:hypothetical protein